MNKKRVYIAYTGGTIGMKPGQDGYRPVAGFLADALSRYPEFRMADMPESEIHEYEEPLDSANMSPEEWFVIAEDIRARYDDYDGFVILHGTDTMAYTASALSFMLQDLAKPVILTGSQIPLTQLRSDARDNLINAVYLAANYAIPEVCLFFHDHLYRGNRSRKVDSNGFAAFGSPNFPPLATVGNQIRIRQHLLLDGPNQPLSVQKLLSPQVAVLTLFPGISAEFIGRLLAQGLQGVVLQSYGMGNAPVRDEAMLNCLRQATDAGMVIINTTQCLHGNVDMRQYQTGQKLMEAGVINGFDLTPEAALTKLFYLFSLGLAPADIKTRMGISLRGELTLPAGTRATKA